MLISQSVLLAPLQSVAKNEPGDLPVVQLRRSLSRWKNLWDVKASVLSNQARNNLGFAQYALEFWWMAMLLLEAEVTRSASIVAGLPVGKRAEDTSQMYEVMRRLNDLTF
jgi:hypothetical protein